MKLKKDFLIQIHKMLYLIWLSSHLTALDALSEQTSIRKYAEKTIERIKTQLHRTLDEASMRRRRSFRGDTDVDYETPAITSETIHSESLPVVAWCVLRLDEEEIPFAATEEEIGIFDTKFFPLVKLSNEEIIYSLLGFLFEDDIWLVTLQSVEDEHSFGIYKYSDDDSLVLEEFFALPGESFAMVTEVKNTVYLPILSNKDSDSILNLFVWKEFQFELIVELPFESNGKALASWEIFGILFVAVSFNDILKIFHFSEMHERLILTQQIEQTCDILKHFKDEESHSLICSGNNKILLYMWNGDRFSEQQEICESEPVVDITMMSLSEGNVMMISVKPNRLEFYFQDSGLYIKSKETEILEDGVLKNVEIWKKADAFYLLPVFHDYDGITVLHLDINFPKSPQPQDFSSYFGCVQELEKMLNDTNDKIKNRDLTPSNIWTKDRSFHIPEVHVKGAIVSNRVSKISRISFTDSDSLDAQSISNLLNELSSKLRNLQCLLRNAVLKSTNQKIYGNFKFDNQLSIMNANISRLADHLYINGVHTSVLTSVLKKSGSQTISHRLTFNGGNVKSIETNFLNSKVITDYLLLTNPWEYVKGHIQFKNLAVNNIKVKSHMLNNIALADIVTTSSPQNITSRKTFRQLSSAFINTNGNISGLNMNNFKNIILKDTSEFGANVHFTSDVTFRNLYVRSINGKDLSHLVLNSVKRSEDQSIQGIKTFTGSVTVENIFTRYINNIKLSDLMTLHTPQIHYNDIELVDASFKEIKTNSVNGIDLSKEAVQKTGDFKINDKVIFTERLVVTDDIILKNGVLLRGIDLSNVATSLFTPRKNIFNDPLEISNIIVKNNVEISDARIKTLLNSLTNDVWLKSKRQFIPYAHFNVMKVKDLNVNSLNDVSFDEIVLCSQPGVINSAKEFVDFEVQSLSLQDGTTVNGIDFTSNSLISSFFEKLKTFRVKDMLIKGNLDLFTLNNLNIADLMQKEKFQVCDGPKTFHSISVNELVASTLDFENIHNRSFSEYIADSVSLRPLEYILNKKIDFISSEGLDIAGFLNGRRFMDLYESVVTLDSHQVIPSDIVFVDGLELKSATMKNLNIPSMENIVFRDRVEKNILHKRFQSIYANEAHIGFANGVDISEFRNAFLKSKDNWVSKEMRFKSDLKISKIKITSPASIDGVRLDDTFKTNSATNLPSMNLSNIHTKNVDVLGTINGCDLFSVREFLMKNISVKTKKYFTNLVVEGNLHVKNVLNGLHDSAFFDIASSLRSSYNIKRSYNFPNVKAIQLKVLDVVNGINIDFLLKDAVKSHLPQIIFGRKSFSKITASNIILNMLNVTFLNKINIPLLYRKYLSKTANQIIALNLPNITAGEVFIKGRLNGVKLPEDVVLVHTNEKISSDVIFKESITASNMHISAINNTDLQQFLRSIVSLTSDQTISSTLIFVREFVSKGDLHIVNSLHGINLNDVVKTSNRFAQNSITGNKIFREELNLKSDLKISGAINNIDLENLSENLCQRSRFEFFEDMVYFTGLNASTLYVASVNNISLEKLLTNIHSIEEIVHDQLDSAADTLNEVKDKLLMVKDSQKESTAVLAYFILHQVLNVGFSLRFLPIFDAGVFGEVYKLPAKEMIVWVNQNETCTNFKSLKFTVQQDGTLKEIGRLQGRIYPFSLRILEDDVQGFKFHVDRAIRCTTERKITDILKTVFTSGNDSVFALPPSSNSSVLDAKLLETKDGIFMVIAYEMRENGERMHVYEYEGINDTWIFRQKFHFSNVSSFDMIYIDDDSEDPVGYLVITGKDVTSGIYLYLWDFETKEFIFKSSISKVVSTSVFLSNTDYELYLFLAKEKTKVFKNNVWSFVYSEPVEVYVLEDDLKFRYEINIHGISSFNSFRLEGETYVLAVSPHLQTVYLLQYRGFAGFQVIQEFSAPGVVSVSVFSPGHDVFLAIASKTGQTRVLKCVMRGENPADRKEIEELDF